MYSRRLKTGYFFLEGFNSFATVFYFYYFYFFMHQRFGFGTEANLALAAVNGGAYALFAWSGGRFAQRFGYFTALKLGFSLMPAALAAGLKFQHPAGQILAMVGMVFGMSFTWPTLEGLVSEREPPEGLQHMVGLYNVIWAGTAALAYFSGGAVLEQLGYASLFYIPIAIQLSQLGLVFWLEAKARAAIGKAVGTRSGPKAQPEDPRQPAGENSGTRTGGGLKAKAFLRMAWLANPFAYIGIQTLIAAMPSIATRLQLSTMLAGFCGSVWCFARLGAFFGLWLWNGWHYRFRWLLLAYLALIGSFAAILLAANLVVLVTAQLVFGAAIGLIYYSSLFYSMDVGETKGEHGGIHEAVIGLGNCVGPTVGAAALYFVPQHTNSGALAVTALLLCGLGGLTVIWRKGR